MIKNNERRALLKECGKSNQWLLHDRKVQEIRQKKDKQEEGICYPPCHEPTKDELRRSELSMKWL